MLVKHGDNQKRPVLDPDGRYLLEFDRLFAPPFDADRRKQGRRDAPAGACLERGDFFAKPIDGGGHLGLGLGVLGTRLLRLEQLFGARNER